MSQVIAARIPHCVTLSIPPPDVSASTQAAVNG